MPIAGESPPAFTPPGPGSWTLDTAHFPRPVTRYVTELFADPARRGFGEATARYGLLLDHIEWAFVHRWAYLCPRPVSALADAGTGLTRADWDALAASNPALGARLSASARVFEARPWREDVRVWDDLTKPALRRRHLALQAAAPTGRGVPELAAHLERCRDNLHTSIYEHHRLNVAPVIPAGDFLVHAAQWTGRPASELVGLLRGPGPLSAAAAPELARLAGDLRRDPAAAETLSGDDPPEEILAALTARPGPVGAAARGFVDLVSHWSVGSGSDVGEPCLHEMPSLLVENIRAAAAQGSSAAPGTAEDTAPAAAEDTAAAVHEETAAVRADVPPDSRPAFDELLAEARATHRVRDERATYCDVWAYGLARRAILATGAHLAAAGRIERPEHLVEAGHAEMRALLEGGPGPAAGELAARARYRTDASDEQVPTVLGDPPRSPVPVEWLPPGVARTERAFRAYVGAMSEEVTEPGDDVGVRGLAASPGSHEGRARVVRNATELGLIEPGDVLVTGSTTPAFNAVLALVGAIVTDRGGLLSHAAIVAREYGIPAVVGTREATSVIPDGAVIRVDGDTGEVRVTR